MVDAKYQRNWLIQVAVMLLFLAPGGLVAQPDGYAAAICNLPPPAANLSKAFLYIQPWPGQVIPYEIPDDFAYVNGTSSVPEVLQQVMASTNVCFIPRVNEENYLVFLNSIYNTNTSYSSHIGKNPLQEAQYIGLANLNPEIIIHEIGHALGLIHEHQRPDRDAYIRIREDLIRPDFRHNFEVINLTSDYLLETPYDYESIMHYGATTYSRTTEPTIISIPAGKQLGNTRFSDKDLAGLRRLYPTPLDCAALDRQRPPGVVVSTQAKGTDLCAGQEIQFQTTLLGGSEPDSWLWTFPGGTPGSSSEPAPKVYFPEGGSHNIQLQVSNAYGSHTITYPLQLSAPQLTLEVAYAPGSETLLLELGGQGERITLEVLDALARRCLQETIIPLDCHTEFQWSVASLPAGTYLVKASMGRQQHSRTFVRW